MVEKTDPVEVPEIESSGKEGDGMKFKDWWSIVLSTLAFLISAMGFYLSNVKEYDDFRLALGGIISSQTSNTLPKAFFTTSILTGSFINSGTRPVAVQDIAIEISQRLKMTGNLNADCFDVSESTNQVRAEEFVLDIEPFVVKPQDIAIKTLGKFKARGLEKYTAQGAPIVNWAEPNADFHPVLICMTVRYVSPDRSIQAYTLELVSQTWEAREDYMPSNLSGYLYDRIEPAILLKEGGKWTFR